MLNKYYACKHKGFEKAYKIEGGLESMNEELEAIKRELLKKLFTVSEAGKLDEYVLYSARTHTRYAVLEGDVEGNVLHAESIFSFCSYIREIAWRALPNGQAMGVTRAQAEAHWGEPQDWYRFSGMKKPGEDK